MRTSRNEQRGIRFKLRGNKNICLKSLWSLVWVARSVRHTAVWNAGVLVDNGGSSYSTYGPTSLSLIALTWDLCPGPHFGSARPQDACAQPCLWLCLCGELVYWTMSCAAGCQLCLLPWGPGDAVHWGRHSQAWAPHTVPWEFLSPTAHTACVHTHVHTQKTESWLAGMLCRGTSTPRLTYSW